MVAGAQLASMHVADLRVYVIGSGLQRQEGKQARHCRLLLDKSQAICSIVGVSKRICGLRGGHGKRVSTAPGRRSTLVARCRQHHRTPNQEASPCRKLCWLSWNAKRRPLSSASRHRNSRACFACRQSKGRLGCALPQAVLAAGEGHQPPALMCWCCWHSMACCPTALPLQRLECERCFQPACEEQLSSSWSSTPSCVVVMAADDRLMWNSNCPQSRGEEGGGQSKNARRPAMWPSHDLAGVFPGAVASLQPRPHQPVEVPDRSTSGSSSGSEWDVVQVRVGGNPERGKRESRGPVWATLLCSTAEQAQGVQQVAAAVPCRSHRRTAPRRGAGTALLQGIENLDAAQLAALIASEERELAAMNLGGVRLCPGGPLLTAPAANGVSACVP